MAFKLRRDGRGMDGRTGIFCRQRRRIMTRNIRALLLAILSVGALALAACNTTAGVGKDVRSAGNAIEDTANDARH
jgi:predicted small secreted protein